MSKVTNLERHKLSKFYKTCNKQEISGDIRRTMIMVMKLHRHLNFFEDTYPELYQTVTKQLEKEAR